MQLHTITELLSIPNYHVSHMVVHSGSRLDLLLEPCAFTPAVCSSCGRLHNTPIHSIGMILVEDLPISGKRVFLHVPKRKSLCIEDGSIRIEELDWLRRPDGISVSTTRLSTESTGSSLKTWPVGSFLPFPPPRI